MGDHADDAADQAYMMEIEGELDYDGSGTKECRYCGEDGLFWGKHEDKWRLFSSESGLHTCLSLC